MATTNAIRSDVYNLYQGMQACGIQILAKESNEDSIKATLEQKGIRGVVTLGSVDGSITFSMHRFRPNGAYIKEPFHYDPNSQKWLFRNSIAYQSSQVKDVFDYIFSQQHENSI